MTKNLVIAFGGVSPEHEVSVLTAMQAIAALNDSEFNLVPLYISKSGRWYSGNTLLELENFKDLKDLEANAIPCHFTLNELGQAVLSEEKTGIFSKKRDILIYSVLTAFHGASGENGSFQGICETYNIPYTGSGVMGSSVGMDKVTAKKLCEADRIAVVEGIDFYEDEWVENEDHYINVAENIGYPLIVKPVHLGSSIGVAQAKNRDELKTAIETAFRYDAHLLVEKAVSPLLEINCSVLGTPESNRASVCERPLGKEELLSFSDKYLRDDAAKGMASADRVIPADIKPELAKSIQETSRTIFRLFNCSGLARFDFLVNRDTERFYFNEINTIPGSFSFYLWKESGLSFPELLRKLIEISLKQHKQKNGRILSYETNLLSKKAVSGIKGLKGTK